MALTGELQSVGCGAVEPANLAYHNGCHTASQHRFHRIERGGIVVRPNNYQSPWVETVGEQSRAMEVWAGGDPERRSRGLDPG